jgi:hypothetical protein
MGGKIQGGWGFSDKERDGNSKTTDRTGFILAESQVEAASMTPTKR